MGFGNKIKELVFAPLKRYFGYQDINHQNFNLKVDYNLKETVEFMHKTILLRNTGSRTQDDRLNWDSKGGWTYLNDPIFDPENIEWYYQEKLLRTMNKDLARETLPEKKEQIRQQISLVKQIKKDHIRMAWEWSELWRFATYRQIPRTTKEIAKLKNIYSSLTTLEEKYQEYNGGQNLAELRKIGEDLGLKNPAEKNLQELLTQARKENTPTATEKGKKRIISFERNLH